MNIWHQQLIDAVNNREELMVLYDEEYRRIEPHAYGQNQKDNDALSAFQVSGIENGWKFFLINKIDSLEMTGESFPRARHGYKRDDKRMKIIYVQL